MWTHRAYFRGSFWSILELILNHYFHQFKTLGKIHFRQVPRAHKTHYKSALVPVVRYPLMWSDSTDILFKFITWSTSNRKSPRSYKVIQLWIKILVSCRARSRTLWTCPSRLSDKAYSDHWKSGINGSLDSDNFWFWSGTGLNRSTFQSCRFWSRDPCKKWSPWPYR